MDQQKIGKFLKDLRKEKGQTQEQLAEKFGVSGRTISRWETGNSMPDISLLVEIASYYNVSIPELIDGERKSEIMNEEAKEVAEKMSDYAGIEKETLLKSIRNQSLIGACAAVAVLLIELFTRKSQSVILDHIHLYCETLVYVNIILIALQATGLLYKFQRKDRDSARLPKPVMAVIAAVLAVAVAVIIKSILTMLLGSGM